MHQFNKRQFNFEEAIILETELPMYTKSNGDIYSYSLDDYPYEYLTLSDVASEYGRDFDFKNRQQLQILVNERFKLLNSTQREIAELKYVNSKTVREIAGIVNKANSTVQYHINKINKIIRSIL